MAEMGKSAGRVTYPAWREATGDRERLGLFDDLALSNRVLDRLVNACYQIDVEEAKKVTDLATIT